MAPLSSRPLLKSSLLGVALAVLEFAVDLAALAAMLDVPAAVLARAALGLAPWVLAATVIFTALSRQTLAPLRRALAEPASLTEAERRGVRVAIGKHVRATLLGRGALALLAALAAGPTIASGAGLSFAKAAVIAGAVATCGFWFAVLRAATVRAVLIPLASAFERDDDALTTWGRELRDRLFIVSYSLGGGAILFLGTWAFLIYRVPGELSAATASLPPVLLAIGAAFTLVLIRSTERLKRFTLEGLGDPAEVLLDAAHLPRRLAVASALSWVLGAAAMVALQQVSGGPAAALAAAALATGGACLALQTPLVRGIAEPMLTAAVRLTGAAPPPSRTGLTGRLAGGMLAIVAFGGTFALLTALEEHERLLLVVAGSRALPPITSAALLLVFATLAAVSLVLATIVSRDVAAPLGRLAAAAHRIGGGDLATPVPGGAGDETGRLARAVEAMRAQLQARLAELEALNAELEARVTTRTADLAATNERLSSALLRLGEAQDRIVGQEKMAMVGRLVAGIAHELNNPLNFVGNGLPPIREAVLDLRAVLARLDACRGLEGGALEAAVAAALDEKSRRGLEDLGEAEHVLEIMQRGVGRMTAVVRALRDFSRVDRPDDRPEPFDLDRLVDDSIALLRQEIDGRVQLQREGHLPAPIRGRAGPLGQVVMNLVKNAAQAARRPGGTGVVRVVTSREPGRADVLVEDDGPGIPEALSGKVFEPFFTTKPAGEGTGLGLSIALGIVEREGGRLEHGPRPGGGTRFWLRLPQPDDD